jgi:membrane protein involved in colicin uptake
MGLQMGVR